MTDMFDQTDSRPLAERMRPRSLEEFVGQEHLLGQGKMLSSLLDKGVLPSLILWGPPGCGKTTLARILAQIVDARFSSISAVLSGVKELRAVIEEARAVKRDLSLRTVLFVDEIHRFNKAQQDAFLPHVESGLITLIGATTENPSFEIISPLLSRCQLLVLHSIDNAGLKQILNRALKDRENGLGKLNVELDPEAEKALFALADGDARVLLNILETAVGLCSDTEAVLIDRQLIEAASGTRFPRYDRAGDEHFGLISAFHKSLRGSDPDAALYWMARMFTSGEDPHYIARRMIRFASEDVGNADPLALNVALNGLRAFDILGSPEGELALVQVALYLATAPKSNATYSAFKKVKEDVKKYATLPVPKHLLNAPTHMMKRLGYGKGYKYPHDDKEAISCQEYLPKELSGKIYYEPTNRGYENTVKTRLEKWRKILAKRRRQGQ